MLVEQISINQQRENLTEIAEGTVVVRHVWSHAGSHVSGADIIKASSILFQRIIKGCM